jgi:hypothetical protein
MNRRTVLILGTALAILIAVLLGAELANDKGQVLGEPLFNAMRDDINAITHITITASGDEVIATLTQQGDEWRVAERDGYPADAGKLRQVLLGLADARLVEAKTANPAYYPRLGVEDITAEDAGGVLVEVATESNQYNVIVGDQTQGDYRYVRRAGEAGSWLIDQNPEVPSQTAAWLNDAIIDVEAALVHSVDIEHPDGETIRLEKATVGQTDFTVTEVPAGRELSFASVGNVVGGVLDNLTLDDVGPAAAPGAAMITTTYRTFDGQVIRISGEASDSEYWIQVAASYDAELTARLSAPLDEAGGEAPTVNSQENVSAAIEALNQRTQQWRYQIPQYKYEQLTRRWEDLLKATE